MYDFKGCMIVHIYCITALANISSLKKWDTKYRQPVIFQSSVSRENRTWGIVPCLIYHRWQLLLNLLVNPDKIWQTTNLRTRSSYTVYGNWQQSEKETPKLTLQAGEEKASRLQCISPVTLESHPVNWLPAGQSAQGHRQTSHSTWQLLPSETYRACKKEDENSKRMAFWKEKKTKKKKT